MGARAANGVCWHIQTGGVPWPGGAEMAGLREYTFIRVDKYYMHMRGIHYYFLCLLLARVVLARVLYELVILLLVFRVLFFSMHNMHIIHTR